MMSIHQDRLMKLIVAAFVATITLFPVSSSFAAEAKRVVITIERFKYVPRNPVLKIGDTVVWRNKDIVPHTATAKDGSWDSDTIRAGGEWQTVVTAAMLSAYYCRHHPSMTASLSAP